MAVHSCPRCELRFESVVELQDHLVADHHFDPEQFGDTRRPDSF